MFLTKNPFSDHGPSKQVLSEAFKYHIPEDIPANERTAFHGAAAAAAKAGKKNFNFGGKTHPVTMKKDTANKIADQKEATKLDEIDGTLAPKGKDGKRVKKAGFRVVYKPGTGYIYRKGETAPPVRPADIGRHSSQGGGFIGRRNEETMSFREKLMSLFESDRAKHYKGATKPEEYDEKQKSSKGAMDMLKTPKSVEADGMKAAKDTAANIAKSAPGKKLRKGDNPKGDTTIIPAATPVNDPSGKTQTMEATIMVGKGGSDYHKKMAAAHGHHGERHATEAGNSDSSAHDFAANEHDEAERLHKVAHEAHKKHGADSKQYKAAADAAHKQSEEAHENSKYAGRFKAIDKPSMKMFPKKPSVKKESYGISGNKVSNSLLDAIAMVEDMDKKMTVDIDHMTGTAGSHEKKHNITLKKSKNYGKGPGSNMATFATGKKKDLQNYLKKHYDGDHKDMHPEVYK